MHVILGDEEQNQAEAYPEWCDLSWFHNCKDITVDVELHYHDAPEIWLWHEGAADGIVDGQEIALTPGVMVYTPPGCLHSYHARGRHSNTGIVPRMREGQRGGHLHVDETGENPVPEMPAFHVAPEDSHAQHPAAFPPGAFLQSAYRATYEADDRVLRAVTTGWTAILVREGSLAATVDGSEVELGESELLIVDRSCSVDVRAAAASEVAFAFGWPPEAGR